MVARIEPLRVCVAGFGKMGLLHSSILSSMSGVELACVVDPSPAFRYFGPSLVRVPFRKTLSAGIRKDRPDVIYVTAPTVAHPELALEALEAGCHTFIEKPLGPDANSCERILKAIKGNSPLAMVGYSKRFVSTFVEGRRLLRQGVIGKATGFQARSEVGQVLGRATGWRFEHRTGGGALAVIGCHLIDLLRHYFGEAKSWDVKATRIHSLLVEDEVSGTITMEDGIRGSMLINWSNPSHRTLETEIIVTGTEGSMTINDDMVHVRGLNGTRTVRRHELARPLPIDIGSPEYPAENIAFFEAIREGGPSPMSAHEAFLTQRLLDGIIRSGWRIGR
jgi:predicted dehydrogenase